MIETTCICGTKFYSPHNLWLICKGCREIEDWEFTPVTFHYWITINPQHPVSQEYPNQ